MSYKLLDEHNQEVKHHDLQDKSPWCRTGASFEEVFVAQYGEQLNLVINPAKQHDVYAPDLLNIATNNIGDLKTQNTPFFQAASRFGLDPQYAVTFNVKDRNRYAEKYPSIEIYFWVKWIATTFENYGKRISVQPMEGLWKIKFLDLLTVCIASRIHSYQQRVDDTQGNAKGSFVLDLRNELFSRVL
ncbi:MAG TPA: hypothetical protein VF622_02220 [Segetibacter sp.]|jgi:hypothetical protein